MNRINAVFTYFATESISSLTGAAVVVDLRMDAYFESVLSSDVVDGDGDVVVDLRL